MPTPDEQREFFERHRPGLLRAAEAGGASAVVAFIQDLADPRERTVLYAFAREAILDPAVEHPNLDLALAVARAGIEEVLRQAASAPSDAERRRLTSAASLLSWNLAADLADCWPGERAHRRPAHFEAGLRAAQDCARWREELGQPAGACAAAWWAQGMHHLSLGDPDAAVGAFNSALAYAESAAGEGAAEELAVTLARGFLALARRASGAAEADRDLEAVLATLRSRLADPSRREAARAGIDQLETVRERCGGGRREA